MIKTFVFDKTGTLTEEGLSVLGFREVDTSSASFNEFQDKSSLFYPNCLFTQSMAASTAITYVDGELIGDPLDIKMFEATEWSLNEPTSSDDPAVL
jgi:cation-transporting ATPase 13A2